MFSSAHASSGLAVAFPDVCKVPVMPIPMPIPYPNIAKTAQAAQKKKSATKVVAGRKSAFPRTRGDAAGAIKGVVSSKTNEMQQLKTSLSQLNTKLQGLRSTDPNEWQSVLQEYVVAASALYVTMHDED